MPTEDMRCKSCRKLPYQQFQISNYSPKADVQKLVQHYSFSIYYLAHNCMLVDSTGFIGCCFTKRPEKFLDVLDRNSIHSRSSLNLRTIHGQSQLCKSYVTLLVCHGVYYTSCVNSRIWGLKLW